MTALFGLLLGLGYGLALGLFLAGRGAWPGLLAQWGEAALAADGSVDFAQFVSAYPPLPYLLSAAAEALAGTAALPGPLLAAAAAGGALGAAWFAGLRRVGLGPAAAAAVALALAAHPFTLAALAAGPGPVMAAGAAWWLGLSLAGLRANGSVGAAIGAALALAALVFSDPAGLLVAAAAPLALLLSFPPLVISRGAGGMLLVLLFPALFGLAGFAHVTASHGAGLGAFLAPLRPHPLGPSPEPFGTLAGLGLLGLPVLLAMPFVFWRHVPLRQVGAAMLLLAMAAPLVAVPLGAPLPAPALAAPALGFAAAAVLLLVRRRGAAPLAALLLPASLAAGVAAVALQPGRWLEAPAATAEERALAEAIAGRRDLLIDLAAAPEIAALRGGGRGLVRPGDDRFRLMAMSGRLTAETVAVRDPFRDAPRWRPDRVHAAFPELHARGAPGYRLSREIGAWRIYERES